MSNLSSRNSGAKIPKRSMNSEYVLRVGYPARLILIASSTPCIIDQPSDHVNQANTVRKRKCRKHNGFQAK